MVNRYLTSISRFILAKPGAEPNPAVRTIAPLGLGSSRLPTPGKTIRILRLLSLGSPRTRSYYACDLKDQAMSHDLIQAVEQTQLKDNLPRLNVGDTVDVHVKIIEGSKQRIQIFNGVIIKKQGKGINETITVRRIVANEGVERTFKLHSPTIDTIEVKRHGHVRRAKLYYLRERVGKKRRLRDRRRGLEHLLQTTPENDNTAAETPSAAPDQPTEPVEAAEKS